MGRRVEFEPPSSATAMLWDHSHYCHLFHGPDKMCTVLNDTPASCSCYLSFRSLRWRFKWSSYDRSKAWCSYRTYLGSRDSRVRKDSERLLIPPPSATWYINIQASKSHLSAVRGYTSSYNSLKLPGAKQRFPKGLVIDIFKQPILFRICQGLVAMLRYKRIFHTSSLSFMSSHSRGLQAYTLVPNASISKSQDITHIFWRFLGLFMEVGFVGIGCKASWQCPNLARLWENSVSLLKIPISELLRN